MLKQEFFKSFIEALESKKPFIRNKTYLTYKVTFHKLQEYFYGRSADSVIADSDLQTYIVHRIKESHAGARKDAINLNSLLKYLGSSFKLKKPTLPESTPKFLNRLEVVTLQKSIYLYNPEISRMVVFALDTGMRLGELLHLKNSNLDFDNEIITVSNSCDFTTKSGKIRLLPMTNRVLNLLTPQNNSNSNDFVFNFPFVNKERYVQKHFKKYLKQIGLRESITWHMLRHTFASLLVRSGSTNIQTVSELLGHADIKTTLIYAKLDMETKRRAVAFL